MDFEKFSIEDFVLNKQFRAWIEKPDKASNAFWHHFLTRHPEKLESIKKAEEIIRSMQFRQYQLEEKEVDDLWNNINQQNKELHQTENEILPLNPLYYAEQQMKKKRKSGKKPLIYGIAASLTAAILIIGLWFFTTSEQEIIYTTGIGERIEIVLPDGSLATLNANSSLTVPAKWTNNHTRKVLLKGEAFFEVKKMSVQSIPYKFIVYSQGIEVEVLGTSFNVNSRNEKVQVVLNTGKVRVSWKDQIHLLEPGEMIEVNKKEEKIAQKEVNPQVFSSWKDNMILCDATSINRLKEIVENQFGYKVVVKDVELNNIEVSGYIPLDSIEIFCEVLSKLIQADVEPEDGIITIKSKTQPTDSAETKKENQTTK